MVAEGAQARLFSLMTARNRFAALLAALALYALWGSPTPDRPGVAELLIFILLAGAAGWSGLSVLWRDPLPSGVQGGWIRAGQVLFCYGLVVPVLGGLLRGQEPLAMIRDGAAFLFMLMPLFLWGVVAGDGRRTRMLTVAAVIVGMVFAVRAAGPLLLARVGRDDFAPYLRPDDLAYFANAPTVLFAALMLWGGAGWWLYARYRGCGRVDISPWGGGLVLAAAGAVPFAAMALAQQRVTIMAVMAGLAFLLLVALVRRPYRAALLWGVAAFAVAAAWPVLDGVFAALWAKTMAVGANNRWQEAAAVMAALDGDVAAVLWGKGWGALLQSPAVGEYPVNFTHNLLTAYWLKTGLCGVGLVLLYLGGLARFLWPLFWRWPVIALALAAPLGVNMLLYASYKSLDFGIILLLLAAWGTGAVSLHRGGIYSMSEGSPD